MVECRNCPLRTFKAFESIDQDKALFLESLKIAHLQAAAGETVIAEGQTMPRLYTLFKGWAFRYKTLADGRRQILNFLLTGDFVGLQNKLDEETCNPHGVEALTASEWCSIDTNRFKSLFQNYPEMGYDVVWLSSREEQYVDEYLLATGRRSAIERVAMLLLHLFRRARSLNLTKDNVLTLPLKQIHIADALGLSVVHVNRTLQKLDSMGVCTFHRGKLLVGDTSGLEDISEYFLSEPNTRPLI